VIFFSEQNKKLLYIMNVKLASAAIRRKDIYVFCVLPDRYN